MCSERFDSLWASGPPYSYREPSGEASARTHQKAVNYPLVTGSALQLLVKEPTMASADSCSPIPTPHGVGSQWQANRPLRVRRATFLPSTRRIYFHIFWIAIGLRVSWPSRPDVAASYAVPVRRARSLPTASFRFRLTTNTLAVQLTVPAIRVRRGLSPPSHPANHHGGPDSA